MKKFLFWSQRISVFVWLACIIVFLIIVGLGTNLFRGTVQDTDFGKSSLFAILLTSSILLGIVAFGFLILTIVIKTLYKNKIIKFEKSLKGFFFTPFKIFLVVLFFPLFVIYKIIDPNRVFNLIKQKTIIFDKKFLKSTFRKVIVVIGVSLTLLPLWIGGYIVAGSIVWVGLGFSPDEIAVSGTGSMFPTFPKRDMGRLRRSNQMRLWGHLECFPTQMGWL